MFEHHVFWQYQDDRNTTHNHQDQCHLKKDKH